MNTAAPSSAFAANLMLGEHASALRRHVQQCRDARGHWFGAAALAERVHVLIAPRFVSTVVVAVVLLALASGWS